MADISPLRFNSVQDYLKEIGFTAQDNAFVREGVSFSVNEIIGHTPNTFYEKAKKKGWLEPSMSIDPSLSEWAQRFLSIVEVNFI